MRLTKAKAEFFREIADRYRAATGKTVIEAGEAVAWAMARGELELSPDEVRKTFTAMMSAALQEDSTVDGDGNKIRLQWSLEVQGDGSDGKPVQRVLWAHIDAAEDEFLAESLRQQYRRIASDVASLKANLNYLNERRRAAGKREIQMSFDFSGDEPVGLSEAGS